MQTAALTTLMMKRYNIDYVHWYGVKIQESPANAKGTRDSSACMKAHCEQM